MAKLIPREVFFGLVKWSVYSLFSIKLQLCHYGPGEDFQFYNDLNVVL